MSLVLHFCLTSSRYRIFSCHQDGYPNQYEKGKKITNISDEDESIIFHAGTKLIDDNIISNGGRVLACTGFGSNLSQALNNSYRKANEIVWEDKYFRKDIGKDLM